MCSKFKQDLILGILFTAVSAIIHIPRTIAGIYKLYQELSAFTSTCQSVGVVKSSFMVWFVWEVNDVRFKVQPCRRLRDKVQERKRKLNVDHEHHIINLLLQIH